ncbi:RICIN domain-containing protein [Micromonospora chokoriensis]
MAVCSLLASGAVAVATAPGSAHAAGSWLRFSNVATARMLDSNAAGSAYTHPNNEGAYQTWFYSIDDDDSTLRNGGTNRCLDHNLALNKVTTSPCDLNNPYQSWNLHGNGLIQNRKTGQCLDDNRALNRLTATGCDAGNPYRKWRQIR